MTLRPIPERNAEAINTAIESMWAELIKLPDLDDRMEVLCRLVASMLNAYMDDAMHADALDHMKEGILKIINRLRVRQAGGSGSAH